jgi:hypothetical protein
MMKTEDECVLQCDMFLYINIYIYIYKNILEGSAYIIVGSLGKSASYRNEYWDHDCGTTDGK